MRSADLPLLTAAQEIELARRIHGDDQADALRARDELVLRNMGLVRRVAADVYKRRPGRDWDDLASEATVALMQAAALYNPSAHHTRFSTYAVTAIYRQLRLYTDAETLVRVPSYAQNCNAIARLMDMKTKPMSRRKLKDNVHDAEVARRALVSLSEPRDLAEMDRCPVDPRPEPLEAMVRHEEFMNMLEAFNQLDPMKTCCHVITRIMSNNALDFR